MGVKIALISIGQKKKGYISEGIDDYLARIKRYTSVETIDLKPEPGPKKGSVTVEALKKEGRRIEQKLKSGDYVVVLSDAAAAGEMRGSARAAKAFNSREFAGFLEGAMSSGKKRLCFIVGGPYGLHGSIIERADLLMSLSRMTLPHGLARLVLAEQIYRAFTIMRGEPYSH